MNDTGTKEALRIIDNFITTHAHWRDFHMRLAQEETDPGMRDANRVVGQREEHAVRVLQDVRYAITRNARQGMPDEHAA